MAIALVAVLTAPPAGAASLRDALVTTYLTSPRLEAGRSELRQVDETVPQALAGYRPSLFVNGDLTGERSTVREQRQVFEQNRAGKSVNLTLRQNLYAGGGTQAQVSRAENQVQAQRSRLYGLEQQVLLDAVDAYTAAYRDQAVLDLALNNEERLKRQLEATRDRFDVGEVARTDVAQAEARLSRARADVEQAKADLASSRAAYQRVVGEEPTKLEEPKVLAELPKTEDETRAFAAQNPDIVAATFDLYAARDNVDVAFSDLLPSLDLRGEVQYADEPTAQVEWGRTGLLGLTLSIPLYQGGGEYSRVRQNRQVVRQRRDELETAHRSVQELVTSSWERLLAATAAIDAFRAEVRANQIALEGVQQEALVGARTVLDVLDAEQELFTSQVNLVRASREEVLASYQLKLAVGQLTVEGLSLPVQAYNPVAYYNANRTRLFGLAD
ncbi:MAG: TolC family outer membrane protein [Geminicoccaceae bacterium]